MAKTWTIAVVGLALLLGAGTGCLPVRQGKCTPQAPLCFQDGVWVCRDDGRGWDPWEHCPGQCVDANAQTGSLAHCQAAPPPPGPDIVVRYDFGPEPPETAQDAADVPGDAAPATDSAPAADGGQ